MGFFRPEALAALLRWREALVGAALALLGLWWIAGPGQLLSIPGAALMLAGGALIWIGTQRARFRNKGGGAGAVQVDEGQVIYFGPMTGGAVALRELERLTLDRSQYPGHWRLDQPGTPALLIPVNAEGSDALFDAFATLPGLRTERMLAELRMSADRSIVIWQKRPMQVDQKWLH
ncbi:MAG: hypothetical protein WBC93_22140 [Sulfitobacter sp.]